MIYITQLIFIKEGKEELFHQFEDFVLPLLKQYDGQVLYRVRPEKDAYISGETEKPYEIHFVTFPSEEQLNKFMRDDNRKKYIHLKDESVKSILLIKGAKL